ncbi:MAG TPA: DUF1735 domain-containing protein [Flavitalea sp.]|nr:DUF1735 domain-containing protein [Flavitalea sp.]
MKFKNISFKLLLMVCLMAIVSGCHKPDIPEQANGKGSTIVRMPPESGFRLAAIDLVTTSQTFGLVDIYRDVPSEEALHATTQVVITEDPSIVTAYNTEHGTSYIPLPAAAFTSDVSNPKAGNDYTLTFNPGEFYKQLKITVPDATVLNPNNKYALGFKIASVDKEGKISSSENQVVVEVGIKNKWDGVYTVNGTMVDLTNATLTGNYPLTWELRTTGSNTLAIFDKSQGTQTHLILSSGAQSQYGSFGLNITIDPITNKITGIVNSYGQPAANGRSAMLDPTGINAYDPATNTFRIKYFLLQPGTTIRTTFDETWVFSGVR